MQGTMVLVTNILLPLTTYGNKRISDKHMLMVLIINNNKIIINIVIFIDI